MQVNIKDIEAGIYLFLEDIDGDRFFCRVVSKGSQYIVVRYIGTIRSKSISISHFYYLFSTIEIIDEIQAKLSI